MTIAFRITVFMTLLAVAVIPLPVKSMNLRKLDDTTPTTTNHVGSLKEETKCDNCPCSTTCYSSPPPPTPSPPSPPPPSPPPPPKKTPPTPGVNFPPPPAGGGGGGGGTPDNVYTSGPPKDVYPVIQSISAARRSLTVAPPLLVVMLAFW